MKDSTGEHVLSTRVYPLGGLLALAEKEYQKCKLPIHLLNHVLSIVCENWVRL